MSEIQHNDLMLLEPEELIDRFISDVCLPDTRESNPSREIYRWYEQYCEHFDLGTSSFQFFSRHVKKRFQHRRIQGRTEYFCILKPELRAN